MTDEVEPQSAIENESDAQPTSAPQTSETPAAPTGGASWQSSLEALLSASRELRNPAAPSPSPDENENAGDKRPKDEPDVHRLHACVPCRRAKTGCSGERPCPRCVRLGVECVVADTRPKKTACVGCHKAKTACNGHMPCSRCKRLKIVCTLPEVGPPLHRERVRLSAKQQLRMNEGVSPASRGIPGPDGQRPKKRRVGPGGGPTTPSSLPCWYGYYCTRGLHCEFSHADEQLEFFKVKGQNGACPKSYKLKMCEAQDCIYEQRPEWCTDAHGKEDFWCTLCGMKGHIFTDCTRSNLYADELE